ncbi:MAG: carbonic anhydrase [Mycobacterium sp.]
MENPSTAWQRLRAGNQRVAALRSRRPGMTADRSPVAVVFRCADADTPSEAVLGQSVGSLIDVSTWGHVIDTGVLASLEYAVGSLKTPLIVVLGHEHCAAMHTAMTAWTTATFPQGAARAVVEQAISSLTRLGGGVADADELSAAHVANTGAALLHKSPLIAGAVDSGQTAIVCLMSGADHGPASTCATFGAVSAGDSPLLECV